MENEESFELNLVGHGDSCPSFSIFHLYLKQIKVLHRKKFQSNLKFQQQDAQSRKVIVKIERRGFFATVYHC